MTKVPSILYLSRFPITHMQRALAEHSKVNVVVCGDGFTITGGNPRPNVEVANIGHCYPEDQAHEVPEALAVVTKEQADRAHFAVFDFNYDLAVKLRNLLRVTNPGLPVIGPTAFTSKLEFDREFGHTKARDYGLLPGRNTGVTFYDCETASSYIQSRLAQDPNFGCVLKAGISTLVFKRGIDAVDVLKNNPYGYFEDEEEGPTLWVEDYVIGQEIAFGSWFDGEDFIPVVLMNREYKGAHDNNHSSLLTGESGTYVEFREFNHPSVPKQVRAAFEAVKKDLAAHNYVGFIDMNFILDDQGLNFLEWTTRWGYPTEIIMTAALRQVDISYFSFCRALAYRDKALLETIAHALVYGVRMGLSLAYMFAASPRGGDVENEKRVAAMPRVHGLDTIKDKKNVHWGTFYADVFSEDGQDVVRCTDMDRTLILTAFDDTLSEAYAALYEAAAQISIWGCYYRGDIGRDLIEGLGREYLHRKLESLQ